MKEIESFLCLFPGEPEDLLGEWLNEGDGLTSWQLTVGSPQSGIIMETAN